MPTKQAEAITSAITEVLNDSLESISESFVSKAEMQKASASPLALRGWLFHRGLLGSCGRIARLSFSFGGLGTLFAE